MLTIGEYMMILLCWTLGGEKRSGSVKSIEGARKRGGTAEADGEGWLKLGRDDGERGKIFTVEKVCKGGYEDRAED